MLQAEALLELFTLVRQQRDRSIICFTGFTLEQLRSQSNPNINRILNNIDVLIDGQYISELNDNKGWRGSSNQVIHFLSPRHLPEASLFFERERNVEIHLRNDAALMVGIPPHNFQRTFKQTVERLKPKVRVGVQPSRLTDKNAKPSSFVDKIGRTPAEARGQIHGAI